VLAARGNNDGFPDDPRVELIHFLDVEGWRIGMRHDMEQRGTVEWMYERYLRNERVDIMVSGHTHFEHLEYREGAVIMNSGSPSMPHNYSTRLGTAGLLELAPGELKASIIRLGESEERRNPGMEGSLHIRDGELIEDNKILAVA
jgi:predicted phosphodiesterase